MTTRSSQTSSGTKAQTSPQTLWERTKDIATQIIDDENQKQLAKTERLKAARLKKEAAERRASAKAATRAKS